MKVLSSLFFQQSSELISQASAVGYLKPEQINLSNSDTCRVQEHQQAFKANFRSLRVRTKGLRLLLTFIKTLKTSWFLVLVGKLLITVCIVLGPLLTNQVLHALRENLGVKSVLQSLALLLLQKSAKSLLATHVDFLQYKMGCTFYGQLAALVYDQQVNSSKGKTLNLLEEDGYRLINLPYFLVELLIVPLQIGYGVYVLCWAVGLRLLSTHLYIFLAYLLMCLILVLFDLRLNKRLMGKKDRRSEVLLEYLNDSSETIGQKCLHARATELSTQRNLFSVEVATRSLSSIICSLMLVVALISFSEQLTQGQVFSLILLFNELRYPCMQLPSLLSNFVQEYISLIRIEGISTTNQPARDKLVSSPTALIQVPLLPCQGINGQNSQSFLLSQPAEASVEYVALRSLENPADILRIPCEVLSQIDKPVLQCETGTLDYIFLASLPNIPKLELVLNGIGLARTDVCLEGSGNLLSEKALVLRSLVRQLYHKQSLVISDGLADKMRTILGEIDAMALISKIATQYKVYTNQNLLISLPGKQSKEPDIDMRREVQPQQFGIAPSLNSLQLEHNSRGSIGLPTYSAYLKVSHRGYLLLLFTGCCVAAQALSIYSTLTYRRHTQDPTITFTFNSLLFFTPFLSIAPTACGLVAILAISVQASRSLFSIVINQITNVKNRFEKRVIANRLSNDLKFFDKNFCLCIYDISSTGCAVFGSIGLCLLGIVSKSYLWMLGILMILTLLAVSMYLLYQRSMWALRECLRLEGGFRTLSISTLYDCSRYSWMLRYFGEETSARQRYLSVINHIVRTHLTVISIECWFGVRLLFLSLMGCTIVCGVSFLLELDPSIIGLTMSYTLALDDLFQTFFLNAISLEKSGVAVQRCLDLIKNL